MNLILNVNNLMEREVSTIEDIIELLTINPYLTDNNAEKHESNEEVNVYVPTVFEMIKKMPETLTFLQSVTFNFETCVE